MGELSSLESQYGAANYKPLPVTLARGKGVHVWDQDGRRYLDMMGAYSAVSFGRLDSSLDARLFAPKALINIVLIRRWRLRERLSALVPYI